MSRSFKSLFACQKIRNTLYLYCLAYSLYAVALYFWIWSPDSNYDWGAITLGLVCQFCVARPYRKRLQREITAGTKCVD